VINNDVVPDKKDHTCTRERFLNLGGQAMAYLREDGKDKKK